MTIKGTLETFNFRELLQMLAFNQKVGTLILSTEDGTRTIHVDHGRVAFVVGDEGANLALLRVLQRLDLVSEDRLKRALKIQATSNRYLGHIIEELGAVEPEALEQAAATATGERFLSFQLTSVSQFEFADGQILAPDGTESTPIHPWLVVDSLLLDLTRKMDQWAELSRVVPGLGEIYESTGLAVDLDAAVREEEVDVNLARLVIDAYDGVRSLEGVTEVSMADELTVVQVTAALVERGAVRPVPTEDLLARGDELLARGEAQRALPVLRRGIERPEAPPEARLRYAEALVACGQQGEAATQLDMFASLSEDSQPRTVFDALLRALELRGRDAATAARVCDFYLRNRPWLSDRKDEALETLRALIHGAVKSRRPLDAARRLAEFVSHGDAKSEDRLVLADLYAAGGEPVEAAAALFARAEDLLGAGRLAAGRELLQRTIQLDPSRADARSRLHHLQGEDRRKRRRRRTVVFLVLLGLLLCGVGAAWLTYNDQANASVRVVRERAEVDVTQAEEKAFALLDTFSERLAAAEIAETPDAGLNDAATVMLETVAALMEGAGKAVYELAVELDNYPALAHREPNVVMLRHLETRCETAITRAQEIVNTARERGRNALTAGEKAYKRGAFRKAAAELRVARNLAFADEALAARAQVLLPQVETYIREAAEDTRVIAEARASGDMEETYRLSVELLRKRLESDLTRDVRLPVRVLSDPAGAEVRFAGERLEARTPCIIDYSPFGEDMTLEIRLPGRLPHRRSLPSYEQLAEDPDAVRAWSPNVRVDLSAGPAWVIAPERGPFKDLWSAAGVPVLLTEDGETILSVNAVTGELGARRTLRRPNPARRAGTLRGGYEWRILGQRTLAVLPPGGRPWETSLLGRLDRPPCLQDGAIVIVDELGTVYALEAGDGAQRWRRPLGSAPNQAPMASQLGLLVSSVADGPAILDPHEGRVRKLPLDARGFSQLLPFGDGAVVIGGGSDDVRVIGSDGMVVLRGTATIRAGTVPWVSNDRIAWIEDRGVVSLSLVDEQPVHVSGLGPNVIGVSGADGILYASCGDGVLRAARLDDPTKTLWQVAVGSPLTTAPLLLNDYTLVLVGGGVIAVAR